MKNLLLALLFAFGIFCAVQLAQMPASVSQTGGTYDVEIDQGIER